MQSDPLVVETFRLGPFDLAPISSCLQHSSVTAGETFTIRSRYDNERPVPKSMGIMLAHVYEPGA